MNGDRIVYGERRVLTLKANVKNQLWFLCLQVYEKIALVLNHWGKNFYFLYVCESVGKSSLFSFFAFLWVDFLFLNFGFVCIFVLVVTKRPNVCMCFVVFVCPLEYLFVFISLCLFRASVYHWLFTSLHCRFFLFQKCTELRPSTKIIWPSRFSCSSLWTFTRLSSTSHSSKESKCIGILTFFQCVCVCVCVCVCFFVSVLRSC